MPIDSISKPEIAGATSGGWRSCPAAGLACVARWLMHVSAVLLLWFAMLPGGRAAGTRSHVSLALLYFVHIVSWGGHGCKCGCRDACSPCYSRVSTGLHIPLLADLSLSANSNCSTECTSSTCNHQGMTTFNLIAFEALISKRSTA